ncbi:hypothetical protein WwAna1351 [Wolbachia endosymbiont of Drosophila ananassae]|nr:hypothetical protein WwAna1351 [Wolbachia endosymbiont of Drosophila ananassae]
MISKGFKKIKKHNMNNKATENNTVIFLSIDYCFSR